MEKTFKLYSLDLKQIVTSLRLGEIFQIRKGVSLRALDGEGKMFIEASSSPTAPVVVLKDKVVLEMAQGATGDEFSVDSEKFVLLAENQVFITQNKITKENVDKIHDFSDKAMRLVEEEATERPLYLISESITQFKTDTEAKLVKQLTERNKRIAKITSISMAIVFTLIGVLFLIPDTPVNGNGISANKKIVASAPTIEKELEVSAVGKETEVDTLKNDLAKKRELVGNWNVLFEKAVKSKDNNEKVGLYSKLITDSKIDLNKELWSSYPKSKLITKYWNNRVNSLFKSLNDNKIKAKSKRMNTSLLIEHYNILEIKNQKKLKSYERSLRSKIKATWVKAVFDPDTVKAELTTISSILPADHKIQKSIRLKLKAL